MFLPSGELDPVYSLTFEPFRFEMKGGILDFRNRAGHFGDFESFPVLQKPRSNKISACIRRDFPLYKDLESLIFRSRLRRGLSNLYCINLDVVLRHRRDFWGDFESIASGFPIDIKHSGYQNSNIFAPPKAAEAKNAPFRQI